MSHVQIYISNLSDYQSDNFSCLHTYDKPTPKAPNMVRPTIDLELYKAQIINLYQDGRTPAAISTLLQQEHDLKVSPCTVSYRLQSWGAQKYNPHAVRRESSLQHRVQELFYEMGLEDSDLLEVLQSEGFQINSRTLRRVRMELGLVRRTDDPDQQKIQDQIALEGLVQEVNAGTIEGYGRELLHRHMRRAGYIVPRLEYDFLNSYVQVHANHILILQ